MEGRPYHPRRKPGRFRFRPALRGAALSPLWFSAMLFMACAAPDDGASPPSANGNAAESTAEFEREREAMVKYQMQLRGIKDEATLRAMRKVPRHLFVPESEAEEAYWDTPLPIGHGQTISQPYMVAAMTELLHLTPEARVLEVGTGSGYQAAVLAELAAEVYTIEIIEPLGTEAAERLKRLGYERVHVKIGDGYLGWPENAPFDAIIVTCAPDHVPAPLVEQLKPGGRMCIPVGEGYDQELYLLTKTPDGKLKTETIFPVVFVPLVREKSGKP